MSPARAVLVTVTDHNHGQYLGETLASVDVQGFALIEWLATATGAQRCV